MRERWAPRLAFASLPLGTGAGLYLWRNWEDLMGGPSGGSELTSGSRTMTEMTRIQFDRRYKLVSSLGKGGFGEVWLATDRATGQKVAVKVLSMKQLPRALVEQEVTAMRRCGRHPNVVALLDAVLIAPDDDNPFGEAALVMELAKGGGLFERLVDEGAYSEEYAAKILRQIAIALYHLHSRGIVHRDIKPENVVFESEEKGSTHVKLIDFGTALALEERGEKVSSGGRIGTWSYWAPEQLNQQPYDFAVDMWSLGVLLYILLVGFHPFDPNGDGSEQQILANMKAARINFDDEEWRRVSPKAKSLVNALLVQDPAKRLTSAELVTHPWVRGEDVPVRPLPATHERLSAFIKARHAFYGSLLMGILAHHLNEAATAEGVGADGAASEFNAMEVGWKQFDRDGKGHIDASDLRRVCLEMGYKVSQRDVENMIAVMAPTQMPAQRNNNLPTGVPLPMVHKPEADDGEAAAEAAAAGGHAKISFERYKTTMQASFMRTYDKGHAIFRRGDPVDHFYVITRGECDVLVPQAQLAGSTEQAGKAALGNKLARNDSLLQSTPSNSPGTLHPDATASSSKAAAPLKRTSSFGEVKENGDVVIASLGPGDFFGETGLLEGRTTRGASVVCRTPVEVMAMDREIFKRVAGSGGDGAGANKIADSMRAKADARQRARLTKVFEMMNVAARNRRPFAKGSVVFHQGDAADHFYIVNSGHLEMSLTTPDGRAVRVKRLGPGDHFGYDALLAREHDTTVSCLTEVEVTAIPQDELRLASSRDQSGYLGETIKMQLKKSDAALATAVENQDEAQILPMMAKAAVAGGGVEYDKYEEMLGKMGKVAFSGGDCVFRQGDPATAVYLVTAGEWEVGTESDAQASSSSSSSSSGSGSSGGGSGGGGSGGGGTAAAPSARKGPIKDLRVVATLGPGDHFGETALLEERSRRNTTVRCVSPACELREMPNKQFSQFLAESKQLHESVHAAAVSRNNRRVRKLLRAADEAGKASTVTLSPGQVLFRQGDRSTAFYLVEKGGMQMSITPVNEDNKDEQPVPTRQYSEGECFGASGLMPGDNYRRDTATAIGPVTLKVIPHNHFRVMLRDDQFLKAGLEANEVLATKRQQRGAVLEAYGASAEARQELLPTEIYDELEDEVVKKAMNK